MNLKKIMISGLSWSFTENIAQQGVYFIVGIVMARLLDPHEFGLIGMITIFLVISEAFTDGGFMNALIRKKKCTQTDYSTVFFFNITVSILFYSLLFGFSGAISKFFNEPQLRSLIRVTGIILIIRAVTIVHLSQLIKKVNFKLQARISIIAAISSGIIGISMASWGYGVWSLVVTSVTRYSIFTILLGLWNKWSPSLVFSISSFRDMFSFGNKLLLARLINEIFKKIYHVIIGKFFSATDLGYFTRANQFKELPSKNISTIINRVTYPVLTHVQDNLFILKRSYKKILKSTMFITFFTLIGIAAVAKPMVISLIGIKWLPSVKYLTILCFAGIFYILQTLNWNILKIRGRSDLFLILSLVQKILIIPIIIIGIYLGIYALIIGILISEILASIMFCHWTGKLINYSLFEQIKDIMLSFLLALLMGILVHLIGFFLSEIPVFFTLIIQITFGVLITLVICEFTKIQEYKDLKNLFRENFSQYIKI